MEAATFKQRIFSIRSPGEFNALAVEIFHYQQRFNPVYAAFVKYLGIDAGEVLTMEQIPFLPIGAFRTHRVVTGEFADEVVFESSGTTGELTSRHHVADFSLYEASFTKGFRLFYGDECGYSIFGLLPSYLGRETSSLIYMVKRLMENSDRAFGGFYLDDLEGLTGQLMDGMKSGRKVMLIGVTFALLDLAERMKLSLPGAVIVETGGMKGRRRELTREELHATLTAGLGVETIHSEYGMTELLSQAWSKGNGLFRCPPWMKVIIRETEDPLSPAGTGRTGGINVIDLANLNSCCFIATQDLGRMHPDSSFEVLGRFDHSDIRGCSLLVV